MVKGKSKKMLKSAKVDMSRIPPCHRCLVPHIKRVNYRLAQWKQAHLQFVELSSPTDQGWTQSEEYLEPVWSEGPILPDTLMDLVADGSMDTQEQSQTHELKSTAEEENFDDNEPDYDDNEMDDEDEDDL